MATTNDKHLEIIANLLFAYVNKDGDCPHEFEVDAVNEAADLMLREYAGGKYGGEFFLRCKRIVNVSTMKEEGSQNDVVR